MKKKLTLAAVTVALAASPFAAAPAQASAGPLCAIWEPGPIGVVFCTVESVLCSRPGPPLTICR
jgi:ABC-type sugar transport system substrate-binding protein